MSEPLAEYRCLKCGHQWKAEPGPTPCIKCGHDYVEWLNYEEMENEWGHDFDSKLDYFNKKYFEKYGTFFCDDLNLGVLT